MIARAHRLDPARGRRLRDGVCPHPPIEENPPCSAPTRADRPRRHRPPRRDALASPALAATDSATSRRSRSSTLDLQGRRPAVHRRRRRARRQRRQLQSVLRPPRRDRHPGPSRGRPRRQHRRRRRRQVEQRAGRQPDLLRQHQVRLALRRHRQRDEQRRRPVGGRVAQRINFVYVPVAGRAAAPRATTTCVFSVEPVQTSQYIARAFFPSTPKRSRNVLVDDSIWTSGSWTPSNILGPRARPHARLPPRAHAPRVRHLLRGQQLAPADAVRLGVDHALPAVQRVVEQPRR